MVTVLTRRCTVVKELTRRCTVVTVLTRRCTVVTLLTRRCTVVTVPVVIQPGMEPGSVVRCSILDRCDTAGESNQGL